MPAAISPSVVGSGSPYTISGSKGAIADLSLNFGAMTTISLFVTNPTPAGAAAVIDLIGPSNVPHHVNTMATGTTVTDGNRQIKVLKSSTGGTDTLECQITATAGAAVDVWHVQMSISPPTNWTFQQPDNDPNAITVTRLMCDPVSGFTPSGDVSEKQQVTLTGMSAIGPATVVGTPAPAVYARWSFSGAIAIPDFPSCAQVPSGGTPMVAPTMPAVYGPTAIQVTEEVWFDSPCPTPGLLTSATTNPITIQPRPQLMMLVLDRTGSMAAQERWVNAVKGARLLVHLIAALRPGVNKGDRIGILFFDDPANTPQGFWHDSPRSTTIQDKIPLGPIAAADGKISGMPSLDFGAPGANTPIGDALATAIDELAAQDPGGNPHFTIILLTDGIENSGTSKVDPATSAPPFVTLFNDYRNAHPNVNNTLSLFAIGLGTFVQDHVLDQLPLPPNLPASTNPPIYRNVTQVHDLVDAIGQMVSFSLEARQTLPLTAPVNPSDPSPPADTADSVYFELESNVRMVAVAVLWPDNPTDTPTDTIVLSRRDKPAAPGSLFTPQAVVVKKSPSHGFVSVDLGPGAAATQWRVQHKRGGNPQPIAPTDILVYKDLFAKADISFDRGSYGTGDSMVISARVRAGDAPVSGATISVALAEPGESLGTFLVQGSKGYQPPRPHGVDPLSPKAAMLDTVLHDRGLGSLPILAPTGIFTDGTDKLHEVVGHPDGAGNYEATFGPIRREGTHTFRFHVQGKLPDGSPYQEVMTVSKWVGVTIDALASTVVLTLGQAAPPGSQALQAVVTPRDRYGQYLGPFWPNLVKFNSTIGTFQGEVDSRFDGTYVQTLVYPKGTTPVVTVTVGGTAMPPEVGASGCLGFILSPLLRLVRWLIRLATAH